MSSYLNFYLVPKKEGQGEVKPLFFTAYSRGTAVYDSYKDVLCPVFGGLDGSIREELTHSMADSVVKEARKRLEKAKTSFAARTETVKELLSTCSKETARIIIDEFMEDSLSIKEYITELEEDLKQLEGIAEWVDLDSCSDFEKVLVNID